MLTKRVCVLPYLITSSPLRIVVHLSFHLHYSGGLSVCAYIYQLYKFSINLVQHLPTPPLENLTPVYKHKRSHSIQYNTIQYNYTCTGLTVIGSVVQILATRRCYFHMYYLWISPCNHSNDLEARSLFNTDITHTKRLTFVIRAYADVSFCQVKLV